MELQNSIPHQPLSEVDLAKAGHDLTSWILQDDIVCDQDFCYGAKESHSPSAGVESQCDSPFTDIDIKDHLFDVDVNKIDEFFVNLKADFEEEKQNQILEQNEQKVVPIEEPSCVPMMMFDEDIHLDQLMKAEMNHQLQLQRLQFIKEQEERELKERERQLQLKHEREMQEALLYQERLMQQEKQRQIFQQKQQELVELQEQQQTLMMESQQDISNSYALYPEEHVEEVLYIGSSSVGSPASSFGSADCSPSYEQNSGNSPCIIPVTISEACSDFGSRQQQFTHVSFSDVNEPEKPKAGRLVIKVKKHTIPVINVTAPRVAESQDASKPTLKDVLQSDNADDFIRDLMKASSPSPSFGSKSYQEEYSGMSDDSMDDEIPNNISSLLSPTYSTYSSDYSSSSPSQSCSPSPSSVSGRSPKVGVRGRPYAVADRKERKKEQNKRAALRYREKKREEEMELQKIIDKEEARRIKLQEKFRSLQLEIKCMKKLAREMLTAQGKI